MIYKQWIHPSRLIPPHDVTHQNRVEGLAASMEADGWRGEDLIGYQWSDHRIQLLSGSHRLEAAKLAGLLRIPVVIYTHGQVWAAWGDTEKWQQLMKGE